MGGVGTPAAGKEGGCDEKVSARGLAPRDERHVRGTDVRLRRSRRTSNHRRDDYDALGGRVGGRGSKPRTGGRGGARTYQSSSSSCPCTAPQRGGEYHPEV